MYAKTLFALASLLGAAQAHYWIENIDGQTSCQRTMPNPSVEMNPITGSAIQSDAVICNAAKPITAADIKPPCSYAAGSKVTAQWSDGLQEGHPGPCVVYASKKLSSPITWTKIYYEGYHQDTGLWCHERMLKNGNKLDFPIPANMESGDYIFRIEHVALHVASSPNGAQLYMSCFDINVTNGGSAWADQGIAFPGEYQPTTPGLYIEWWRVVQDPSYYPGLPAPDVYNFGSGGSSASGVTVRTTTTTRAAPTTTTTRAVVTTTSTSRAQPTTTTTAARTSTTTVSGGGADCAAHYGQCGGKGWTGATCCASGTTCKVSNDYYSQCL
ncbi:hypothetical protein HDV00_004630 [Rhizophlyctis rosea]|nr:hypothetical protein HDV00_004630 [Rhizophlyctis rosea]